MIATAVSVFASTFMIGTLVTMIPAGIIVTSVPIMKVDANTETAVAITSQPAPDPP